MKKTLLFITGILFLSIGLQAQEWNFGNDSINFPINAGVPAGTTATIKGLAITAGTTPANMGQVDVSLKTFGTVVYHHRFKFNGGGYTGAAATDVTPAVNMPTQRYVSFPVNGNSTITVHGITGSNGSDRKLFVTDGTNFIGSIAMLGTALSVESTFNYTGPATTLYMFCNASINLYYMKVGQLVTSVKQLPSSKGVSYNGTQILNERGLKIELYNVLGKLVARSSNTLATGNLPKGVYVVRVEGSDSGLKFSK